jgi:hypothetical protein
VAEKADQKVSGGNRTQQIGGCRNESNCTKHNESEFSR